MVRKEEERQPKKKLTNCVYVKKEKGEGGEEELGISGFCFIFQKIILALDSTKILWRKVIKKIALFLCCLGKRWLRRFVVFGGLGKGKWIFQRLLHLRCMALAISLLTSPCET